MHPYWKPNRYSQISRTEPVQYPRKKSRDKNMEEIARLVYQFPGQSRASYMEGLRVGGVNRRLFYKNVDSAIAAGLVFMVHWKLYPSPKWDFVKWSLKV